MRQREINISCDVHSDIYHTPDASMTGEGQTFILIGDFSDVLVWSVIWISSTPMKQFFFKKGGGLVSLKIKN